MKKILLTFMLLAGSLTAIELDKIPPKVSLTGKDGSCVDGTPWVSTMLKGKVHLVFYVDPDKRDINSDFSDAVKAKKFDGSKFGSVAIINLAASWMPNRILESKLKEKQKQFPRTLYVKDMKKVLVEKWSLEDDSSDVLIFDKKGKLIYKKFGAIEEKEIEEVIKLIEKNL